MGLGAYRDIFWRVDTGWSASYFVVGVFVLLISLGFVLLRGRAGDFSLNC